ncbi:hypothetical protein BDF20DRAFT_1001230 [Mycotypha africana]|uniref:uncharacterized protein n=1 Tax=Mycotypha africana TaxID=64632 RepID=UPI0023007581|nr:uncharacterized protein BDF20DRAFT_1001230 [Mycotypha africana]KAI8977194.1 hypothetical protein BDF20DRAFT_1001230 [Mycotypha africana]
MVLREKQFCNPFPDIFVSYPYQQYPYLSYGGYANPYQTSLYGQQQLLGYPTSNYYNNGGINPYLGTAATSYYPTATAANTAYLGNTGYYNGTGYGGYGLYGNGMTGYGSGGYYMPYYKQSTLRNIINRIRHGSNYGYYPGYDYGRHHYHGGSWLDL